jgi:hypothetical protein
MRGGGASQKAYPKPSWMLDVAFKALRLSIGDDVSKKKEEASGVAIET